MKRKLLINDLVYLIGERVKSCDAALVFTTQCAKLVNPIEGQPRSDPSLHDNLPNSVGQQKGKESLSV
jgi:hypothetical protein